jgi:hypothetical protein
MRHKFLVVATRPSREQIQAQAANHSNGKAKASGETTPFDEPDYDGSAFFAVTIHEDWKHPAALALAFTEASRTKEGKINHDYLAEAIASGEVDPKIAEEGAAYYRKMALDKVLAANTPADQIDAAVEAQYRKELMAISIKIGEIFNLQDWAGEQRDPGGDIIRLVGTEFSGKVETSNLAGATTTEVTKVYSKSVKK